MKKLVLIGGGEVGRGNTDYETEVIDKEIVKLTDKEKPNFLFIGLASSFADSYYDTMKLIYKNLGCVPAYLKKKNIINNPDIVKNKIESADIIYIGGGDTIKLLENINQYNLSPLLKEACERGCVMVGISAGAIALAKEGFSDSYILREESNDFEFVKGLSFTSISICPHYKKRSTKSRQLEEKIENKKIYAIEDGAALKIVDKEMSVIRSKPRKNVYLCFKDKIYKEEKL